MRITPHGTYTNSFLLLKLSLLREEKYIGSERDMFDSERYEYLLPVQQATDTYNYVIDKSHLRSLTLKALLGDDDITRLTIAPTENPLLDPLQRAI